eukprot:gi/632943423/ref/XP_007886940.1/ PREDICTED: sterile alpha motif domain-containing protein 9-like [Callorhinchus milii]
MPNPPKSTKGTSRHYDQCNPHPFDTEDAEFKYIRNTVLPPETGSKDLITPCHEYKSFQKMCLKDKNQQRLKFGTDVMKFAAACMNTRTNGTIHFGVEDGDGDYVHGEIVGVPVRDPALFVQARDVYIQKCFMPKYCFHAERSIRPPRFVEVTSGDPGEQQCFVIEVDIVPSLAVVQGIFYSVRLPVLKDIKEKNTRSPWVIYKREGAASISVGNEIQSIPDYIRGRDFEREEAERREELVSNDVYRKLANLFASVKRHINNKVKYVLVINSCKEEDLENLNFLLSMRFFCVFDFDPNSKMKGLGSRYPKASFHFLEDCTIDGGELADDVKKDFFQKTAWIFCNGQNDYGDRKPCEDGTWMQTRRETLANTISQICKTILPPGSFEVLFLLVSTVDQPLAEAFQEFYTGMNSKTGIKCIAADRQNYSNWVSFVRQSCNRDTINNLSIVGTKLNHLDAMIQIIQSSAISTRQLLRDDKSYEELLPFIEVLRANEYNSEYIIDKNDEQCQEEIKNTEMYFYRGGKVNWMNFWLADNEYCGEIIQRDAYKAVERRLKLALEKRNSKGPVLTVTIAHQPGSGGSTVARHILWDFSKRLRCGIINTSQPEKSICEHVVKLQESEKKDESLPMLLLAEDCDEECIMSLKDQLTRAVGHQTNVSNLQVILLHCMRVNNPETYKVPERVMVHYNLSPRETSLFKRKLEVLKKQFKENAILTFVLMTQEYNQSVLSKFVKDLLTDIGFSSVEGRLLQSIALLNHYVQDSYITVSQFVSFLNASFQTDLSQGFESTSNKPMNFLLSHLFEATTELQCIRVIHHKVAEEILDQIKPNQSQVVTQLLEKDIFFQQKSTTQVSKFIRQLFVQRKPKNSKQRLKFPPMIAHIAKSESNTKAVAVQEKACECFDEDAIVIQQLVRFLCKTGEFEKAKSWIEKAKILLPSNSYILDTEGQVYKKWLYSLTFPINDPGKLDKAIELALKAINAFQRSQEASESETDWNNSGYFGEVEVGCYIVQLMPLLGIFSEYKNGFYPKLVKYLVTEWVPEEINVSWAPFHDQLKSLHNNICKSMEWIYVYMAYFQPDEGTETMVQAAFENLKKNERQFSSFFNCPLDGPSKKLLKKENMENQMALLKHRKINYLGGGRFSTIFALAADKLREIIDMDTNQQEKLNENYVLSRIAFAMIKPTSPEEDKVSEEQLHELSLQLQRLDFDKPIPHFILLLLHWPDSECNDLSGKKHDEYLTDSLTTLNNLYKGKIKDIQSVKKPTYPHFFLGSGSGFLKRFVHNRNLSRNNGAYDWEANQARLQRVEGSAEGNKIYIQGHCKDSQLPVHRAFNCSIPPGSTRVSFYLGFTLRGCVAYDIQSVQ